MTHDNLFGTEGVLHKERLILRYFCKYTHICVAGFLFKRSSILLRGKKIGLTMLEGI